MTSAKHDVYGAFVAGLYRAKRAVLDQMSAECAALGGDGVIGARLVREPFQRDERCTAFRAVGTAVRAAGEVRSGEVFLSHLSGQEFTALVEGGWVPVDIVLGDAVAERHDDWKIDLYTGPITEREVRLWSSREVAPWSGLVRAARFEAHQRLLADARRTGADGVVLSGTRLSVTERRCPVNRRTRDHIVEATFSGTAIAQFRGSRLTVRPLTYLPL